MEKTLSGTGNKVDIAVAKHRISKTKTAMTARRYKQLLSLPKNLQEFDLLIPESGKQLQNVANGMEDYHTNEERSNSNTNSMSQKNNGVKFRLRRVKCSGHQETENNSNCVNHTKLHQTKKFQRTDNNFLRSKQKDKTLHHDHKSAVNFVEYWVPVNLSNVQLEQYCGSLLSQSKLLCSSTKPESWDFLHEILISTRKCCDHPYLVDRALYSTLIQVIPEHERLDAEIKLSSKLLLLQKILLELKIRKLRALVLYQCLGGAGSISTRDILEDIMHEKFNDSFVCIYRGMSRPKRLAAINTFNELSNGAFVCLMDTRACRLRTKLLSVDTVILFNSDWDPLNDLNALKRINLHSQFDKVKLFRLYSCRTIEEKALILAKQGMTLEGNTRHIRKSVCHRLLSWGSLYLFRELDEFHKANAQHSHSITSGTDSFLEDVFHELSELLPNKVEGSCSAISSLIVEVNPIFGTYPKVVSLRGEVESSHMTNLLAVEEALNKEPPHVFWMNLLDGRKPNWVYFRTKSPRSRKRFQIVDAPQELAGDETTSNSGEKRMKRTKLRNLEKSQKLSGVEKYKKLNEVQHRPLDSENQMTTLVDLHTEESAPLPSEEPDQTPASTARQDDRNDVALDLHPSLIPSSAAHNTENLATENGAETFCSGAYVNSPNSDNHRNAESTQVLPEAHQFACTPLQSELQRLQEQQKQISEQHEEKKLKARMAYEKEIEQLRKKYEAELHNAEVAFVDKREMVATRYKKVYANALLAEALMQRDKLADANKMEEAVKSALAEINNSVPHSSSSSRYETIKQATESPTTAQPSTRPITPTQHLTIIPHVSEPPQVAASCHVGASYPISSTNPTRTLYSRNRLLEPVNLVLVPTVTQMVQVPTRAASAIPVVAPEFATTPVNLVPSQSFQPGYERRSPAPHLRKAR